MTRMILLAGTALSLAGCAQTQVGGSLVFGRTQTVGVSVAGSVPDQGAHLTLGYSDHNIAVVPTTTAAGERIRSLATKVGGVPFEDALSVLGQFEVNPKGSDVSSSLGTFFSTGMASRNLAEGFRDKMRGFGSNGEKPGPTVAAAAAPVPAPPAPVAGGGGN